jgi:O-acetyl-ADP-ribose deacetylase (regulator of RNase III)
MEVQKVDITTLAVDVIVNAANTSLLGGGGVDGAIHKAAGPELLMACKTLGGAKTGEAKITRGFKLPAKFVIHTPGPIYDQYEIGKVEELLASCYRESLKLAERNKLKSIAFPCISTGVFGFPKLDAARVAVATVYAYLLSRTDRSVEKIIFVVFSDEDYDIYENILSKM